MHRIILAAALGLASGSVLAFQITCDKPEYLQLKTADKTELTEEYCRAKQGFELSLRKQADYRESAARLSAQGLDTSKTWEEAKRSLDAGASCHKVSIEYLRAIERRFKPKHLPVCE